MSSGHPPALDRLADANAGDQGSQHACGSNLGTANKNGIAQLREGREARLVVEMPSFRYDLKGRFQAIRHVL